MNNKVGLGTEYFKILVDDILLNLENNINLTKSGELPKISPI